jgi:hypothetical protein
MLNFAKSRSASAAAILFATGVVGVDKAAADFVIADDLIVQGSTCVGLDCVNGEVFNFDTLILKENNLRIFFNDTSVSAGFPANDWRIIVNDSANGGANFFAIEDSTAGRQVFRVDAGARLDSIHVGSTGNVGFGTATPVLLTHARNSDTPAHRLEQDNSGGFTAQTWDVAGNEANFFVRDVTGGSRLPLRIRPGAPTSSLDIAASGNVGIGTASPANKLTVQTATNANGLDHTDGTTHLVTFVGSGANLGGWLGTTTNQPIHFFTNNGVARLSVSTAGNVGVGTTTPAAQFHTTAGVRLAGVANCAAGIVSNANGDLSCLASSRQFKHVGGDLAPDVAVANIMALKPQIGAYKETPDVPEHWLIAEDVAAVDPALVGLRDGEPYTVKIQGIVADLVAVIQQQQRRIEALERAMAR